MGGDSLPRGTGAGRKESLSREMVLDSLIRVISTELPLQPPICHFGINISVPQYLQVKTPLPAMST
jgi:hypothetical protein